MKFKQVAEELGVRYILEGSVRKAGDEIRINAQLIDATTGHHLWAERYDGKMNRVFALQDKITQKIVSALNVKLTGSEKEQVSQRGTDNIDAYNALLEGMREGYRYTPDGSAKAHALYKKAIELDPNYGRAYAYLAHIYYWRGPALKDPLTQKIISAPTLTGPNSDRGKSRIEGDTICHQFEKLYWGLEFCGTVFKNPKGTNESKDEYFFCNDIGFEPFSLVR